tara:strand:- start:31721 stop:32266 length:546 start_codon:yes stop_codon:yes gene_type:complete
VYVPGTHDPFVVVVKYTPFRLLVQSKPFHRLVQYVGVDIEFKKQVLASFVVFCRTVHQKTFEHRRTLVARMFVVKKFAVRLFHTLSDGGIYLVLVDDIGLASNVFCTPVDVTKQPQPPAVDNGLYQDSGSPDGIVVEHECGTHYIGVNLDKKNASVVFHVFRHIPFACFAYDLFDCRGVVQ